MWLKIVKFLVIVFIALCIQAFWEGGLSGEIFMFSKYTTGGWTVFILYWLLIISVAAWSSNLQWTSNDIK